MKKIIIVTETEYESNFRLGAFEKAIEFEEKYMSKTKIGKENCLIWGVNNTKTGKQLAKIYVHHTKTTIVATVFAKSTNGNK